MGARLALPQQKMTMKLAHLSVWVWVCCTACARSPEASAPAASSTSTIAPADQRVATPESAVAAPAPAPASAQGLDTPKSKAARDEAEFGSLEEAERALNQAKADLDRLALAEPAPAIGRSGSSGPAAEKKESKPARAPSPAGAAAPVKSNAVCEEACRAFSSLARAASAVCRLDGATGSHCNHAKHVLADAQQRVASCSCAGVSD